MLLINSFSLYFPWQDRSAFAYWSAGSGELGTRVGSQQGVKTKAGDDFIVLLSFRISAMEGLWQYPRSIVTMAFWED